MAIVVENDRDRVALEWLHKCVGDQGIARGLGLLAGARKPFVSNVARALGLEIPKDLYVPARPEIAKEALSKIRENLKKPPRRSVS